MNNQEINTPLNPHQAPKELEKEGVSEWGETELIKIGNVVSGGTPSTAISNFWNGDILFVTPFDLSRIKSAFIENTERKISKEGLATCSANLLPVGSIVISSRAPIGYIAIGKKEFTTNQGCKSIVPSSNFDSLYLYYCLNFYVERIKRLGAGSTFAEISKGDLELVKLPHPKDKKKQIQIAKILNTADAVIEKTQAAIAKYKAIKQGLLHDLFTRGVVPETVKVQNEKGEEEEKTVWKLRPTYQEAPHLYKESKLGMVPREWEVERLKVYCDRISVGIATSSSDYFVEQGVLFLRNQNIKENRVDLSDTIYISQEFADANSSKYLKKGDVITVRTGYPGISAVVEPELENSQTFTTLITTPNSKMLDSYFLAYFLNSDYGRVQVLNLQGGGAQQNLNSGALETMQILKPELSEQKEIVKKLKSIEKNIQTEQAYLQKLHQLKAGLMGDLLSGRVRVK